MVVVQLNITTPVLNMMLSSADEHDVSKNFS